MSQSENTQGKFQHCQFPVTEAEMIALDFLAKRENQSVGTYMRDLMLQNTPAAVRKAAASGIDAAGLEGVYRAVLDHTLSPGSMPYREMLDPSFTNQETKSEDKPEEAVASSRVQIEHPCLWCRVGDPEGWAKNTWSGVCAYGPWRGRTCRWPAGVANSCDNFRPKGKGSQF